LIKFDNDEYIVGFYGRAGNMIDALGLTTSRDKNIQPIGGPGGKPF